MGKSLISIGTAHDGNKSDWESGVQGERGLNGRAPMYQLPEGVCGQPC